MVYVLEDLFKISWSFIEPNNGYLNNIHYEVHSLRKEKFKLPHT